MRSQVLLFAAAIGLLTAGAYAQEVTAGVYGSVTDASGSLVPGATITLRNLETARTQQVKTDESGNFVLTLLPIGTYDVSAEASGFKVSRVANVVLRVNDNRRLTFTLEVGTISDQVTVAAELVAVNTASGATSAVLEGQEMVKIPSKGRYVFPFALLMPGAISTTPGDRRNNNTSVNGVRPTHNAWLLDGGYNIDTGGNWGAPLAPNVETVAEFRALRGNYSAEFGIGSGAQFNVVTKGGTNELHGSAYEFVRNDKFNARNYFSPSRQAFRGNDFGFTIGGPVYIPKVYNGKNKTFFFVHIGFIKERRQELFLQKLPEIAYRSGNFGALGKTVTDPLNGAPFPGNVIPASRFDKNATGYTKMYPDLNYPNGPNGNNWTATQGHLDNTDERMFRGDHTFGEKHRLMGRYTMERRFADYRVSPGFEWLKRQDLTPARNLVVDFTSTLKPNLINDLNFVRSHNRIMQFPPDVSGSTWGISIPKLFPTNEQTYPLGSLNLTKIPDKVPNISLVNYSSIAPSAPWSNFQTIYDIKDNLTWIRGKHTIKTGFDYAYEIKFEPTNTNVFGDFYFDGRYSGDAFADLLLGRPYQYSETDTVAFNDNRRNAFEAYVDDSWKVTRRFTLNLGLRYSYFPPAHEASDKYRVFRIANYNPAKAVTLNQQGQIVKNSGDLNNGLVNPADYWDFSKKNFAPRVSFAWDIFGDGKTAVRGGYGMFYSREILGAFILMSGNPPFAKLVDLFNTSLSQPGGGSSRDYDLPTTLGSIDTKQQTPYTQQWNLNIQRSVSRNTLFEIGYSGSRGIHMMRTQDINQPLPSVGVANGSINANYLRPFKGFGVLNHREQSYMSNYNGLQTSLARTLSNGIGFQISYTWSKAIDNADFTGGIYGFVPNTQNSAPERGRANFDATHNFVASYTYELPWFKAGNGIKSQVLGGWLLSGITTMQTGLPINPQLGRDLAGVGSSSRQRPETTASPFIGFGDRTATQWFNTSVFTTPALGTFSSLGRNVLSGPGTNNWDIAMSKVFKLHGERPTLEFRAESYNTWNHTQFSGVGASYFTPSSFGRVTSTKNERSFMLGMRLQF